MHHEESASLLDRPGPNPNRKKLVALWVVGILTTIYVAAELVLAIWTKSLVLLSDGFHNLSDVVSIVIAYWSIVKSASGASDTMSFGWKRTEIVGALINACSLLSLCLYILLEAIPRFVHPEEILVNKYFLGIAGAGICVNLIGTIIFYFTGTHAHAHAHDEAEEIIVEEEDAHVHTHSHGSGKHHSKTSSASRTPSPHHSINGDGNGEDSYVILDENGVEVRQKHHSHDHESHHHKHEPGHDHHHHDHEHEHDHDHDEKSPIQAHEHKKAAGKKKKHHDHHHDHDHDHDHHEHGHSHSHDHSHGGHGHSHDMNMWAVFVHYLGDAISSVFVLVTGILVYLFPEKKWSLYLDPISSLIIVGIMLYSTIPLVRQCALILLQRVPPHVNLGNLRKRLLKIENVMGAHDLHVWCLVDGMTICTVHLAIDAPDHFGTVTKQARKLFHQFGIHSSTIQPEYPLADLGARDANSTELQTLASRSTQLTNCEQNCLPNCKEDWCCKNTPNTSRRATTGHGALDFDPVFNPREPDPPRINPPPGDHIV